MTIAVLAGVLAALYAAPGALDGVRIPLCTGLTIVTAVQRREGDYESIKRIMSVTGRAVTLSYSTQIPQGSHMHNVLASRTVLTEDLRSATLYMHYFSGDMRATIPGSTAIGTSAAVLRALKATGVAELSIVPSSSSAMDVDRARHPNVYDFRMPYTLRRVGTGPVVLPVTVNGAKVELPAIQARGDYVGDHAEFFFLDDESNPLALKYQIGSPFDGVAPDASSLQVVRISYACGGTSAIEEALATGGRVDVYDIYFDFGSDRIKPESDPTFREIATVLGRHPDWKLSIEGHTDGVASDGYNLDLSQRRAAAVKSALAGSYHVDGGRLTTAGYGKSRPIDRNDTLEGRARNRRVELVRRT